MTYKVTVTEDVTSVSVSGNTTSINLTGEQTEISVVNPATSVTFNPSQSFTSTNVQDALFEAHKMIGQQTNDYSVTLDYGNKFEIQSGSYFARFFASAGAGEFVAGLSSSDKITFGADGNLTASLDGSGSTFYDKLLVQGSPSQSVGLIQTNNTSGSQQHHLVMKNSGADVGFLGSDSDSALLGIGSISVAVSSLGFLGGDLSPATQYGGTKNGAIDLGKANSRFRDLYLSDNLYADGVSFEDANITFTSDQFILNNASNSNLITTTSQGVNLKYNGVQRLATTNSGVSISGSLNATTGNITNLNTSGTVTASNAVVSGSVSVGGTVDGRDLSVDGDKLDNIESNATADQTDAEIRAAVDAATDSNVYTDAEKAKLTGIESGATADQTDAEIRSAVASATNSNVFTDSEKTKLSGAAELDSSPTFTGTVSSAGLAVDTDTLYVDETNDRVGINTASPDYNLVVADTGTSTVQIKAGNANYSQLNFGDTDDNDIGQIAYIHDSNEMRFTTNNSQAMVIDSSGDVGIGTTNPASKLHVQGTGTTAIQVTGGSSNVAGIYLGDAGGLANGRLSYSNADNSLQLFTNNTERMRINASGKVGIGTSSPANTLTVGSTENSTLDQDATVGIKCNANHKGIILQENSGAEQWSMGVNADGNLNFYDSAIATPAVTFEDLTGNVGIGTDNPDFTLDIESTTAQVRIHSTVGNSVLRLESVDDGESKIYFADNSASAIGTIEYHHDSNYMSFDTVATERMRIDSSGNVGIGTSSPATALHIDSSDATALTLQRDSGASSNISIKYDGASQDYYTGVASVSEDFVIGTSADLNGNNLLRVTSEGNVGIGTSSPDSALEVQGSTNGVHQIHIQNTFDDDDADAPNPSARLYLSSASNNAYIQCKGAPTDLGTQHEIDFGSTAADSFLTFSPNASEKMRIDASGNVLVGKTSASFGTAGIELAPAGNINATRNSNECINLNRLSTGGNVVKFYKDGTTVGSISVTTSATAYNTSSDERLKENITDSADAGSKVDAIQIRQFDWKADGSHQDYGVIAQELVTVAPEAVSEGDTEEDLMGVDYSKLVPMLIKEVQTLRSRVAELENN